MGDFVMSAMWARPGVVCVGSRGIKFTLDPALETNFCKACVVDVYYVLLLLVIFQCWRYLWMWALCSFLLTDLLWDVQFGYVCIVRMSLTSIDLVIWMVVSETPWSFKAIAPPAWSEWTSMRSESIPFSYKFGAFALWRTARSMSRAVTVSHVSVSVR